MGEEGSAEQWWNWWVQVGPVSAATWAGTILSTIGLIVTIFGFVAAIGAAKRAEQEASAAARAVDQLKSALGTSSLAYIHSQIGLLVQFVESQHFYPAHVLLATIKRDMLHHASDTKTSTNAVVDLKRRLKTISTHIVYAERNTEKFKAHILQDALTSIQETIVDWENSLRQKASEASK